MSFLEFSQILVNITVSVAAFIFIVFGLMLGMSVVRITKKIENGIETIKKDSSIMREKVTHFFAEISLVALASKLNSWFTKKKKAQ